MMEIQGEGPIREGGDYQWCDICDAYKFRTSPYPLPHHPKCPMAYRGGR